MVEIDEEELEKFIEDSLFLNALIACGVANWHGYEDAVELFEKWKNE